MVDRTTNEHKAGGMSDRRRHRLQLEISREAADLFWQHGVAGTTGEQIADAVGLSVRTIWRHFRSKEACAEPIIAQNVDKFVELLQDWPPDRSMLDHLAAKVGKRRRDEPPFDPDDLAAMKMIVLGNDEPALRTAWLMACHQAEQKLTGLVAGRLGRSPEDFEVKLQVAEAGAVLRVLNEEVSAQYLAGVSIDRLRSPQGRIARALRAAAGGGVIGHRAAASS